MNEQELRVLVRQTIARNEAVSADRLGQPPLTPVAEFHPSHRRCAFPAGADTDGPCLIEPAVRCNHCGYCLSYGH
jgi:hypothetical protein